MDLKIIALIAIFAAMMANRRISEKASTFLSEADKEKLVTMYSSLKKISLIPILVIFVSYFAILALFNESRGILTTIYMYILLGYALVAYGITMVKMSRLNLPKDYYKRFLLGRALIIATLGAFFIIMIITRQSPIQL